MLSLLHSVKHDLKEWIGTYSKDIDETYREEFILAVYDYAVKVRWNRQAADQNKALKNKTYKDREPQIKGHAAKLIAALEKAPTVRGEYLINKLQEVILAPELYVYDTPNRVEASIDDVDIFLKPYKLMDKPREELLEII